MSYPSDLSDHRWNLIETLLPRDKAVGNQRKYPRRELLNAIFYVNKTGCPWRYLPNDYPPWKSAYAYFSMLSKNKIFDDINSILVKAERIKSERDPNPSLMCIDSQSVKGDVNLDEKGIDGNKKVNGRKRHIVVDVLGLIILCQITAANISDIHAGRAFGAELANKIVYPRLEKILVDKGYQGMEAPNQNISVQVSEKDPETKGFKPLWKRVTTNPGTANNNSTPYSEAIARTEGWA